MSVVEQTPVPISQRSPEFDELLDLYRERKPKTVLEVGTHHGGTLYHWLRNAEPGTLVVAVDSYAVGVDNRNLYPEWTPEGVTLRVVEGSTFDPQTKEEVLKYSATYEWVFIDAGHHYYEVCNDWQEFGSLGKVVAFHDILWSDVALLWRELAKRYETREFVSDPTTDWYGIGVAFP